MSLYPYRTRQDAIVETVMSEADDYQEILNLFVRIDEVVADNDFTEMVMEAFTARYREMS